MIFTLDSSSTKSGRLIYVLISTFLLAGLILAVFYSPVHAAQGEPSNTIQNYQQESTCTPPNDWNQTVRLKNPEKPTKQWTFTVEEPVMDVSLAFFYYQDYDKSGCPYDCSTGECQTDETGKGTTPLGNINVLDGKEGANRGVKRLDGRLSQGIYQVNFTADGNPGSINVGLNVRKEAVPTDTPVPTAVTPPATPTATEQPPTATPPSIIESPSPTPPQESPTPTSVKHTPPAKLPPPTPFPGSPTPMVLIPKTGVRTAAQNQGAGMNILLVIPLGIGITGLGLAFYGIANRLKRQ